MLVIASSILIRLTSFLFLRWIPGHVFPPVIFTSLAIYCTSIFLSPSRNDTNGVLKSLITGVPCRRSWATRLAVFVNLLCGVFTLDFLLRGFILYPTSDLRFSRIGYISHNTADLLLREPDTAQFPVVVSYKDASVEDSETSWIQAATIDILDDATDYTTTITFSGLSPSSSYSYALSNNQTGVFVTSPAPDSSAANKLSFLTSSCMKPNFPYDPRRHPLRIPGIDKMTSAISSLRHLPPSFMLFLGDFIYIDVPQRFGSSVAHYRSEYRRVYSSPSWTSAAVNLPWLHTLDDHEIANDWHHGNTTPPFPAAIDPYLHYHASVNPPAPVSSSTSTKSSYTSFTNGPASFFLLDTRSYRSPEQETILGLEQLSSLLSYLAAPEPPHVHWKIISSSVPFTRNWHAGTSDTWGGFLRERAIVFAAMRAAQQNLGIRIVMLSGDRHEFAATHFPPLPSPSTSTGTIQSPDSKSDSAQDEPEDEPNQDLIEFCTGPLNMFYLPIRTYYQSGPDDVPIKYLPDGNTKYGLVQIEEGVVAGIPSSVLVYSLYIDETVVWRYRLSVPMKVAADAEAGAAAGEKTSSTKVLLPAGEVIYDESGEESTGGLMEWLVKRVLGSGVTARIEHPEKDWIV